MAQGAPQKGTKLSEVTVRQFVSAVALVILSIVAIWFVMSVARAGQAQEQYVGGVEQVRDDCLADAEAQEAPGSPEQLRAKADCWGQYADNLERLK